MQVSQQRGQVDDADRRQGPQGDGAADGPTGGVDGVFGRAGGVQGRAGPGRSSCPAGVSVTPAGPRTNSSAPSSRSRALIVADTPDWTTCSLLAARVKLRVVGDGEEVLEVAKLHSAIITISAGSYRKFSLAVISGP